MAKRQTDGDGAPEMLTGAPATPDVTGEALTAAMFVQTTSRERYRLLSAQAAQLERNGLYDGAMRTWGQAAAQALYDVDRHWCEARAQWCERRAQRPG